MNSLCPVAAVITTAVHYSNVEIGAREHLPSVCHDLFLTYLSSPVQDSPGSPVCRVAVDFGGFTRSGMRIVESGCS